MTMTNHTILIDAHDPKGSSTTCVMCKSNTGTPSGVVLACAWLMTTPLLQSLSALAAWLAAHCADC